jgi:hypothetical protein
MGSRPNLKWGTGAGNEPVSRIAGQEIVPVPIIRAAGRTFRNRQEISLAAIDGKPVDIYYTTDGPEPTAKSRRFTKPFFIDADTTVTAFAVDGARRSLVVTAKYHRIPHDWKITLESKYSSQYTGGGDLALIDGIRGTTNLSDGAWQGYQGKDLVVLVDLGEVQRVSKVSIGFLQDIGSWIWMPSHVQVELSRDGKTFESGFSFIGERSETAEGVFKGDIGSRILPVNVRYVRIRAFNLGKIPAWHPGSGGDAWIFADEVNIEIGPIRF